MVNINAKKIFISLFVILLLVGIYITVKNDRKAANEFNLLKFNGIINGKTYLGKEKPLFVLISNNWFAIMDYKLENNIEKGDSIFKNDSSTYVFVKTYLSPVKVEGFHTRFVCKVEDKVIVNKLNFILSNNKEQPNRE